MSVDSDGIQFQSEKRATRKMSHGFRVDNFAANASPGGDDLFSVYLNRSGEAPAERLTGLADLRANFICQLDGQNFAGRNRDGGRNGGG